MLALADIEDTLALFTEGIAGRYFHIKASDEFASHRRLALGLEGTGQSTDTLYLPEQLDGPSLASYRVLVMEQIGLRECGTFSFRMSRALDQIPLLAEKYEEPKGLSPRTGDFQMLFGLFAQPGLAADIFNLMEKARVLGHLKRTYPGLKRHIAHYHAHLLTLASGASDAFITARRHLWGEPSSDWQAITVWLDQLQAPEQSVYDSVKATADLYQQIEDSYVFAETSPYAQQEESLPDWLNREQRIEEWEDKAEQLSMALAVEMLQAEDMEAERGDADDATVRDADVDIKAIEDERDTMKRRIDMEKSSVRHALGNDRSNARSYRYDEWDYQNHTYLHHWCRVFEEVLSGSD
ncbi:MAG: hypothetical protein ACI96M_001803, partial [Candidatus Azotimanducaceae bacterium]